MSASGDRAQRSIRLLRFLCSWLLAAGAAVAQPVADEAGARTFPLSAQARTTLVRIQQDWLDWVVACNEGDEARAEAAIETLLDRTRLLGMERVPALSAAAAQRAVDFARADDSERARCGLEAAERLDPARPEAAFAGARIAALDGSYLGALSQYAGGLLRSLGSPDIRRILAHNSGLWLTTVLAVTGLLLVAVLMFSRGAQVYSDVLRYFGRFVPPLASHLLALVLLSWPLLLPAGVLWTAIYWSVLFWPYGGRFERLLLIGIWLFIGSLPTILAEQNRRIGLSLFPPVQSIESARRGELEGDLFNHLGLLNTILPDSTALTHLRADMHRKLGQMEQARSLYGQVLGAEAGNPAALNDLGIYYFQVSDYDSAADHFNRALNEQAAHAGIHFNLSQAYSELYRFNESEQSLRQARAIDSEAVSDWLQQGQAQRVIPLDGGLDRVEEIRDELRAQWRVREEVPGWLSHWRRTLSLPLLAVFVAVSVAVRWLARRGPLAKPGASWWRPGLDRLRRAVLAGVPEAEAGYPGRAAVAVLIAVALASLPLIGSVGYSVPWLGGPSTGTLAAISGLGLALYLGFRYWNEGRDRA